MDLVQAAEYSLRRSGVPMSARDLAQSVVKANLADIDPHLSLDQVANDVYFACISEPGPVCEIDDQVLSLVEWGEQNPPEAIGVDASRLVSAMAEEGAVAADATRGEIDLDIVDDSDLADTLEDLQPLGSRISITDVVTLVGREPEFGFFAHAHEGLRTLLAWGACCVVAGVLSLLLGESFLQAAGLVWLIVGLLSVGFCLVELRKNLMTDLAICAGVLNKKMVKKRMEGYRVGSVVMLFCGGGLLVGGLLLGWLADPASRAQGIGLALFSQGVMALVLAALDWWYGQGQVHPRT